MAVSDQRLLQRGRLEEQKKRQKYLRIIIHGLAQSINDLFSPQDYALSYTGKIDLEHLDAFTVDMKKRVRELKGLELEMGELRKQLGDEENA